MKNIQELVNRINDEMDDAKEYAELYLIRKSEGGIHNNYREMAEDELKHAHYIHQEAVEKIEQLKSVYTPPVNMEEVWEKTHREFIEKEVWIKHMLTM